MAWCQLVLAWKKHAHLSVVYLGASLTYFPAELVACYRSLLKRISAKQKVRSACVSVCSPACNAPKGHPIVLLKDSFRRTRETLTSNVKSVFKQDWKVNIYLRKWKPRQVGHSTAVRRRDKKWRPVRCFAIYLFHKVVDGKRWLLRRAQSPRGVLSP